MATKTKIRTVAEATQDYKTFRRNNALENLTDQQRARWDAYEDSVKAERLARMDADTDRIIENVLTAIREKHVRIISDGTFHPGNKYFRAIFTAATGIELPSKSAETVLALKEFVGEDRITADKREREEKAAQREAQRHATDMALVLVESVTYYAPGAKNYDDPLSGSVQKMLDAYTAAGYKPSLYGGRCKLVELRHPEDRSVLKLPRKLACNRFIHEYLGVK